MYVEYFAFRERPFQLVPNPSYLYLSRSHEEALAHLSYAISNGDGFVEITGEVGTGKTTLCRVFLEGLDENTEVAYIFNPKLDSVQLLKAINDEYNISSKADNSKDLIDTLNTFLINKKAAGKTILLLIDEAQNLSKEVLEQIRLLSNLETSTNKLLQIILVGQPELGEMLDSYELRQLGQRITLSWQLSPLSFKECSEYIQHRLRRASTKTEVKFEPAAVRLIYKYSKGIPRLINIACDRCLLTAFGLEERVISGRIARESIKELSSRHDSRPYIFREVNYGITYLSLACLALFVIFLFFPGGLSTRKDPVSNNEFRQPLSAKTLTAEKTTAPVALPAALPVPEVANEQNIATPPASQAMQKEENPAPPPAPFKQKTELRTLLQDMEPGLSRHMALLNALRRWDSNAIINSHLDDIADDLDFYRLSMMQNGFELHYVKDDLELIESLNIPAILVCRLPEDQRPKYVTLTGINNDLYLLEGGRRSEVVAASRDDLHLYWSGIAYLPWKNFFNYEGTIPRNAGKDSILIFKMLMRDIGFADIDMRPVYDEHSREMVKTVQARHNIEVDGVVGPASKIVLYNEIDSLNIPLLAK